MLSTGGIATVPNLNPARDESKIDKVLLAAMKTPFLLRQGNV